jgi:hypothetical protein
MYIYTPMRCQVSYAKETRDLWKGSGAPDAQMAYYMPNTYKVRLRPRRTTHSKVTWVIHSKVTSVILWKEWTARRAALLRVPQCTEAPRPPACRPRPLAVPGRGHPTHPIKDDY